MPRISRRQLLALGATLGGCDGAAPQTYAVRHTTGPHPLAASARPAGITSSRSAGAAQPLRIAFGSCNRVDKPQPLWPLIRAVQPAAWVWLGDAVYADTQDMALMRAMYQRQHRIEEYARLAASTLVTGVWDDHDFGVNDGGREYPRRAESQREFLDFLRVDAADPRRARKGVYTSHTFGSGERALKLILLDVRYHRERPGADGDILGGEQWAWLEQELMSSRACAHLIGSGIQVLPEQHPYEKWANFPKARQRLLDLVRRSKAPGAVLLSGDRHIAELSVLEDGPYPLYELTSSGLSHSWANHPGEPNRHRVGSVYTGKNFGLIELALEDSNDAQGRPSGTLTLSVVSESAGRPIQKRLALANVRT
jgi:alkaline phosphatase D